MSFSKFTTCLSLSGATFAVLSSAAFYTSAEAMQSTRALTCAGLHSHIKSRGSAVMRTRNFLVYRRIVANGSLCGHGKQLASYTTPTKGGACKVKICINADENSGNRSNSRSAPAPTGPAPAAPDPAPAETAAPAPAESDNPV